MSDEKVSDQAKRRAARQTVGTYHEEQLGVLLGHVGDAVDRFRAGELDAFELDEVIFQYSRAAKELWKFCNGPGIESAAALIRGEFGEDFEVPQDWWERGARRRR